jgi:hypothetical protein
VVVGATASLPFKAVLIINNVELVLKHFICEDLKTSIEVVGDNIRVVAQVVASDTNTLIT